MTTAIILFSYFSGIEVPIDWAAIFQMAGDLLASVATVLVVLV